MKLDVWALCNTLRGDQTGDRLTRLEGKAEYRVGEVHRNSILTRGEIRTEPLDVRPETRKSPAVTVAVDSYPLREFLNSSVDS